MPKRFRCISAFVLMLAFVSLAVVAMWPPRPGVTWSNYQRIELGMTESDVETLLGGKANTHQCELGEAARVASWWPEDGLPLIHVSFVGGRVTKCEFHERDTMMTKLWRWLFIQ